RLSRQFAALQKSSTEMVRQNSAAMEKVNRNLASVKKESADRLAALQKTRAEMKNVLSQLSTLRSGKLSSEESVKMLQKEFSLLRAEQEKSRAELEKLRSDRIRLENQCVLLNGQIAGLKKDLALNMEQRNDFSKANDAISKQFAELDQSFRKSVAENASLRKELAKAVREREIFASKVNDQLNESLKESLRSARNEVQQLKNELDSLRKQGNALELKASLAMAQSRILAGDQAQAALKGQISALKERSARAQKALLDSQTQLKQSRDLLAQNRQEQTKLSSRILSLQESNRLLAADLKNHSETALRNMQNLRQQEAQARAALDEALKRQISLNESQVGQLRSSSLTITRLTETLRVQNERLAKLLAESEVLKQQKALLQFRIDQEKLLAGTRSKQIELQAETLRRQNSDLMKSLQEKETLALSAGKKNAHLQEQISSLQKQIRLLSVKEKNLQGDAGDAARVAALAAALEAAKKRGDESEKIAVQRETKVRDLTAEVTRIRKALTEEQSRYGLLLAKSTAESAAFARLQKELTSVRTSASAVSGGGKDKTILQLQNELNRVRKDLDLTAKKVLDANSKTLAESKRAGALQKELNHVRQELVSAREKAAGDAKNLEKAGELEKKLASLQAELALVRKDAVSSAEKESRERKRSLQLQEELNRIRGELASVRKESVDAGGKFAVARVEIENLKRELVSSRNTSQNRETELKTLREELEKNRADVGKLKTELEQSRNALPKVLAEQHRKLDEVRSQLTAAGKNLESSQKILSGKDEEISRLKGQISALQKNLLATGEERNALVKDLESLRKTLPRKEELASAQQKTRELQTASEILRKEKAVLEQTIASLQFRLGSTQSLLEKVRNEALRKSKEIGDLEAKNRALQERTAQAGTLEKSLAAAKEERNMLVRNAAVTEKRLKSQLRQYATEILTMRDTSARQKEELLGREKKIASLQKELKGSEKQIAALQKKLAEALSGEEHRRLMKQIADMTAAMKVLASTSSSDLVREAAGKNIVITELLEEIRGYKGQLKTMKNSVENSRLALLRSQSETVQAQEGARLAVEGTRLARAELAMLKAEILSGSVNVALLERSAPKVQLSSKRKIVAGQEPGKKYERPWKDSGNVKAEKSVAGKTVSGKAAAEKSRSKKGDTPAAGEKVAENAAPAAGAEKQKKAPAAYQEAMAKGVACEKSGDLGMALFHYWNAVDLLPESPEPYLVLVKLHLKRKEAGSARKAYNKAVALGAKPDTSLEEQIKNLAEQQEE
ncbi:MAG: hypothetical protein J6S58_05275, partial [Lentisphaeria bacterium]|nr:hypothetical protein [Lentisphaeria bacterium]